MQAAAPHTADQGGTATNTTREDTMTAIIWANVALVMPFILIWVGVPLWMIRKQAAPDFSGAHAYLAAKQQQTAPQYAGPPQHAGQGEPQLVG